ncbi:MAG: phosphatase PAP2 family protein [Prevotella sp.]|uniref:phosphatase PAP2 family protein n=1 Tax=Prevotella sp. TaxID=59823 RepID=UPI002A28EDAE|nr:phosphatase PAP2 family protein [Prevotella sp.]MDD7318668.1 phosphatase PAP2 family protein [Prevotellaceae bacterium]MDY4019376.1 phosphatase PAP2 family protein [Prevotella sp.]
MEELVKLDQTILSFLNGSDSLYVDGLMMLLTNALVWIPLYLVLIFVIIKNNETMPQILLAIGAAVACVLLTAIAADVLAKPYFERWRPTNDPIIKYGIDTVGGIRENNFGFFSAHAANTMGIAVFVSLLFRSRMLSWLMVLWSLLNGYTRLYLGVHYPGDVIVGFLFGALVGFLTYMTYKKIYVKISTNMNYVSSQYTSTGYNHSDIHLIFNVMMFILLVASIAPLFISIT